MRCGWPGRAAARRLLASAPAGQASDYKIVIMQMRYANAVALFNVKTGKIERAEQADVGSLAVY